MKNTIFLFDRTNYILMGIGIVLLIIGFALMAGGGAELGEDGYAWTFDESIFSFRRIVLAPIIIITGFVVEVFAIMKTSTTTAE